MNRRYINKNVIITHRVRIFSFYFFDFDDQQWKDPCEQYTTPPLSLFIDKFIDKHWVSLEYESNET